MKKIPVHYNNILVGYTSDEGKSITFEDSTIAKEAQKIFDSDNRMGSRGIMGEDMKPITTDYFIQEVNETPVITKDKHIEFTETSTFRTMDEALKSYPKISGDVYFSWDGKNANKGFITKIYTEIEPIRALVIQTEGKNIGDGYHIPIHNLHSTRDEAIKNKII